MSSVIAYWKNFNRTSPFVYSELWLILYLVCFVYSDFEDHDFFYLVKTMFFDYLVEYVAVSLNTISFKLCADIL